ncbi:MAG: multidrug efflux SMR transporter [Hyphomicrobiales bacterium]|nr:multidrug efflux SMR transporter [Hyphomicrobiales bacterium]
MAWLYLIAAGVAEIGFTTALRYAEGFTKLWPSLAFAFFVTLSFTLFDKAAQTIPMGTAYAVWCGIGVVGTVMLGVVAFGEPMNFWRLFFIAALVASITGLKVVSG